MSKKLTDFVDFLTDVRFYKSEINRLLKIEEWAIAQHHVKIGDAVTLKKGVPTAGGWWCYREVLVKGSTGVLNEIYLWKDEWYGLFCPDKCWSINSDKEPLRFSSYGRHFSINLKYIRKRKESDEGLTIPSNLITPAM